MNITREAIEDLSYQCFAHREDIRGRKLELCQKLGQLVLDMPDRMVLDKGPKQLTFMYNVND